VEIVTRRRIIKDLKKVLTANKNYGYDMIDIKISEDIIPLLENAIKELETKKWWQIWK